MFWHAHVLLENTQVTSRLIVLPSQFAVTVFPVVHRRNAMKCSITRPFLPLLSLETAVRYPIRETWSDCDLIQDQQNKSQIKQCRDLKATVCIRSCLPVTATACGWVYSLKGSRRGSHCLLAQHKDVMRTGLSKINAAKLYVISIVILFERIF